MICTLNSMFITSKLAGRSLPTRATRGCLQERILSLRICTVVIDELLMKLNDLKFKTLAYANDRAIGIVDWHEEILIERMQKP